MAPRLTEQQIELLRPRITEYPERIITPAGYPPARRKRGASLPEQAAIGEEAPGALPSGGLTGAPTVRLWSLQIYSNAAGASVRRGSPAFTGPALLHSITGMLTPTIAAGTIYPVQIAYDSAPYTDSDSGPSSTRLPGTHIAVSADPFNNAATAIPFSEGFTTNITGYPTHIPLGIYVPLDRFYVGVNIQGMAAGISYAQFILRVIENAPPESISWS